MRGKPQTPRARMSVAEYHEHLKAIDRSSTEFARYIGASGRSGEKWATEGPTQLAAIILRMMASGRTGKKLVEQARVGLISEAA